MARPSHGETPANAALSSFQTPPAGLPAPLAPATPYGPAGWAGGPAPTGPRNAPTVGGLVNALKRRWVLATLVAGLTAAVVGVAIWLALPAGRHAARSILELRGKGPELVIRQGEDFVAFRQDQLFLLRTRDIHIRTLTDPAVQGLPSIGHLRGDANTVPSDEQIKFLEEGLTTTVPSPTMIAVNLTGDNPDDLKVIVDTLVKKYMDDTVLNERGNRDAEVKKLEKLAEEFRSEISARERSIRHLAESGTIGAEGEGARQARIQMNIATLESEIFALEADIQRTSVQLGVLRAQLTADRIEIDAVTRSRLIDSDPRVATLLRDRTAKEFRLRKDREAAAIPDAPVLKTQEAEIARLDKEIKERQELVRPEVERDVKHNARVKVQDQAANLELTLAQNQTYLQARKQMRDELQKSNADKAKVAINLELLMKELEPQRLYLSKIEAQLLEHRGARALESRVRLKEPAVVMLNHNQKQKILLAGGGSLLAFLGMLVLVGFVEWRSRRIDGVDQVVNELGMRIIGTVPAFPNRANLKAAEAAGNANWRFVLNESINSTRTMLLHTARNQSMQVVMVTSATQGEGKTSLASQLATSMATAGMRTLIVDCDLRNPSIHKLFELSLTPGVSEVLRAETDVSDAVQPTNIPNLWTIPAGQCSNGVITALAQGHPLETLFNRLRGQFDFIIVDSCPVLPVADALLVGQHVDGVVFSIMQDISQLPKVLVASEKLAQLNIPLLGAVVNGIRSQDMYSYGYNYIKQLPA